EFLGKTGELTDEATGWGHARRLGRLSSFTRSRARCRNFLEKRVTEIAPVGRAQSGFRTARFGRAISGGTHLARGDSAGPAELETITIAERYRLERRQSS